MNGLDRRQFVRLAVGGVAASVVPGCAPVDPISSATSIPSLTRAPTPVAERPILRGEKVPGFYVRYMKPFAAPDPETWTLVVDGRVRRVLAGGGQMGRFSPLVVAGARGLSARGALRAFPVR